MFKWLIRQKPDFYILHPDGGLGAQIFNYALGLFIEKKTGYKVKYDLSWYKHKNFDCDGKIKRHFLMKKLFPNIEYDIATPKDVKYCKTHEKVYRNFFTYRYTEDIIKIPPPLVVSGYYTHYKYLTVVEKELQEQLTMGSWELSKENKEMLEDIKSQEVSVAIHVRRGDYIKVGAAFIEPDYYLNAINVLKDKFKDKKIKLYFFSNDFDYVKKEITDKIKDCDFKEVKINNSYNGHFDIYLMSKCDCQIIANSTFSMMSAYLNTKKDKVIICPDLFSKDGFGEWYGEGLEDGMKNPDWIVLSHKTGAIS